MRATFSLVLFGLGWLLRIFGGFAMVWVLIYGIYAIFAKSVLVGLAYIGGAVVGSWIVVFASGLLMVAGVGVATIGVKDDASNA